MSILTDLKMYARMYVRMHVGSGVLSAPLPLSAQEDSENEVISLYVGLYV